MWEDKAPSGGTDVDQKAAPLMAHVRQDSSVHPDRTKKVDIEQLLDLRWRKGFRYADIVGTGVIDQDIDALSLLDHLPHGVLDRRVIGHVEFDDVQGETFCLSQGA